MYHAHIELRNDTPWLRSSGNSGFLRLAFGSGLLGLGPNPSPVSIVHCFCKVRRGAASVARCSSCRALLRHREHLRAVEIPAFWHRDAPIS
jgi:hypothetical protein